MRDTMTTEGTDHVVELGYRVWQCRLCSRRYYGRTPGAEPPPEDERQWLDEHRARQCHLDIERQAEQGRQFRERREAFFARLPEAHADALRAIIAGIKHSREHTDLSPDEAWEDRCMCILDALKAAGVLPT